MNLTMQEKQKLIKFFDFLLNEEIAKSLGEMNSEAVDNYIRILLYLQDKQVDLSPEFIDKQVRKIFQKGDKPAPPEADKTTKKYFNKKKVWLVAACIAILVALFSFVSVAYDWNVFDFLNEKFGSVHSAPVEEEQDFNGVSVKMHGKHNNYSNIENALKAEKIEVLYPMNLPNDITIIDIMFFEENSVEKMIYTFNDPSLYSTISFDTSLDAFTKEGATETKKINKLTCYIYDMSDISCTQIRFEHKGNTYMFSHTDKTMLKEIIKNLEEINYED